MNPGTPVTTPGTGSHPVSEAAENLWDAFVGSLGVLKMMRPQLEVVASSSFPEGTPPSLVEAFGPQLHRAADADPDLLFQMAGSLSRSDRPVFVNTRAVSVAQAYGAVRQILGLGRHNVKVAARFPWPPSVTSQGLAPAVEDLGLMRGVPGMVVTVPADAPTLRTAVQALADIDGPAYLRVAEGSHPTVTDGSFRLGTANTVRDGSDLTVVCAGPTLGVVVRLAEGLKGVGVSVRVLDLASVKPIDAPSLLRAARETGAILVIEEHTVETGLGELVAATVAENLPVPVRRIGLPDLFELPSGGPTPSGGPIDRMRDEAWELLRLRGKVQ